MRFTPCLTHGGLRCRLLAEVEALQEMLILHSASQPLVSSALTARTAARDDLVAQTLHMLATRPPADVWQILQADSARGHARWAELCARCMHAAFTHNLNVPFQEWAATVTDHVNSIAHVPPPTFRKLPLEAQLEFVGAVELEESEVVEVRQSIADALGVSAEELVDDAEGLQEVLEERRSSLKHRHVAARVLQGRIPAYLKYHEEKRQKREEQRRGQAWAARCWAVCGAALLPAARAAARASAREKQAQERRAADADADAEGDEGPEPGEPGDGGGEGTDAEALATEARRQVCTVLRCIARSAQLAGRSGSWLQVANAVLQVWNAMRRLCDDDPGVLSAPAGSAAWVLVPPEVADGEPPAEAVEDGKAGAAAEGGGDGQAGPQGRWTCTAAPENTPRLLRAALEPLLTLTAALKVGDSVLATSVLPIAPDDAEKFDGFPEKRPRTPGAPESVTYAGSIMSLGSDKPASLWVVKDTQLDFEQLTQVVLAAVTALLAGGRPAAALGLGTQWSALTDGAFDEHVMPLCLQAAPRAGADAQPFAAALALVVRDKRAALCTLETVRHAARALGVTSALAAVPAPKLTKARSVRPRQVGAAIGARSRAASSVRSRNSSGTLAGTHMMVRRSPSAGTATSPIP